MDEKYVNDVTSYLQQKLADSVIESAKLHASLEASNATVIQLRAQLAETKATPAK